MKTLFLGFLLLALFVKNSNSQNVAVGYIEHAEIVVRVDKDSLLKSATEVLHKQSIFSTLTTLRILKGLVENTKEQYYYICCTNPDSSIKFVQLLKEEKGKLLLLQPTLEAGKSVSCSGCSKGCDPKAYSDKDGQIEFSCGKCSSGKSKDCKKTVSQTTLD